MVRHSTLRDTVESDGTVFGARASSFSPALIEIYGDIGLDFVWLDFEHAGASPWDATQFEHLTRAADVGDIDLLVRLPTAEPSLIRRVLDAGVRNLLIPRVDTASEVRKAVEATRFVYDGEPGERGTAGARSSEYGTAKGYHEHEDESVCLGVMIEKATAVENLAEILSVPELGFVFLGPGDLSVQLGHPGDRHHPDVRRAVSEVEAAVNGSDVPLGGIAHGAQAAHEKTEAGYRIVRIGGEFESAREVLGDRLSELAALQSE